MNEYMAVKYSYIAIRTGTVPSPLHVVRWSLQHILEREERSRDCDVIQAGVESMKAVAAHINEMKARHEQVVRTQEISSVLHDWHGPDLSTVGHVILEVSGGISSNSAPPRCRKHHMAPATPTSFVK